MQSSGVEIESVLKVIAILAIDGEVIQYSKVCRGCDRPMPMPIPNTKQLNFEQTVEALTPRQRSVLKEFLQGKTDEAIAQSLFLEASTIRRHLSNICKVFGLRSESGERYSHRDELVDLFIQYKPDWINPNHELLKRPNLSAITDQCSSLSSPETITPQTIQGSAHVSLSSQVSIDFPGTPLSLTSPLYVERSPIEARCYQEIRKPGALIRIRAPRRMGKTSLLHRILAHAKTQGCEPITINFRQADFQQLTNLDQLLQWFCVLISQRIGIKPLLDDYWDRDRFGSIVSATAYVQGHILQPRLDKGPAIVLALEEVDCLFDHPPLAQGFFSMLRGWHEEAKNLDSWQRLRLVVVHSTEVYIPLDIHQSPFNVGLPIQLPSFTADQMQALAVQYGLSSPNPLLSSLLPLVGGHPYLTQLAFYHLTQDNLTLGELVNTASTQSGIYSSHLRRTWDLLNAVPELWTALQTVLQAMPEGIRLDPIQSYKLESMGLITLTGNTAHVSCGLYEQYFGTP